MIYWLILIVIVVLVKRFKKFGKYYYHVGFYLFLMGAVISVIGMKEVAELFVRICFIFLLTGFLVEGRLTQNK